MKIGKFENGKVDNVEFQPRSRQQSHIWLWLLIIDVFIDLASSISCLYDLPRSAQSMERNIAPLVGDPRPLGLRGWQGIWPFELKGWQGIQRLELRGCRGLWFK